MRILAAILLAGAVLTSTGCQHMSPEAKTAARDAITIADAECVSRSASLDASFLATFCNLAAEVAKVLVSAKRAGLEKVAAQRGGFKLEFSGDGQ